MTDEEKKIKVAAMYQRYRPEVATLDARTKVRCGVKTAEDLHKVYDGRVKTAQELALKRNADKYGYRLML